MAKEKERINWLSEKEAAAMVGLKPMYFRRSVREGKLLGIDYSRPNYRTYLYEKTSIEAYLLSVSTITA